MNFSKIFSLFSSPSEEDLKLRNEVAAKGSELPFNKVKRYSYSKRYNLLLQVYEKSGDGFSPISFYYPSDNDRVIQKDIDNMFRGLVEWKDYPYSSGLRASGVKVTKEVKTTLSEKMLYLSRLYPEMGFRLTLNSHDFRDEDYFISWYFLNGESEICYPIITIEHEENRLFKIW